MRSGRIVPGDDKPQLQNGARYENVVRMEGMRQRNLSSSSKIPSPSIPNLPWPVDSPHVVDVPQKMSLGSACGDGNKSECRAKPRSVQY
jgi:hypothetical protein